MRVPTTPVLFDWLRGAVPQGAWVGDVLQAGTTPAADHAALTRTLALVPQPGWAPILIEGKDAVAYLHRRLSQAVAPLEMGRGAHALQLAGDGRLQAEYLIYRGHEALFALAPESQAAEAAALIEKYTLRDDVTVDPFWESEASVALAGPLAPGLIASLLDPKTDEALLRATPWIAWFTVNLAGLPCRILRDGRWERAGGIPWFHLIVPPMALGQLLTYLHEAIRGAGGGVAGALAVERLRIEAGVPAWGRDIVAGRIPLEAHLQDAISFDKGCYPGQEVIARITNLGHPAHALVRLRAAGEFDVPAGAELRVVGDGDAGAGEREAQDGEMGEARVRGRITSAVTWPGMGETLALGYLPWAARDAARVEIVADGAVVAQAAVEGVAVIG